MINGKYYELIETIKMGFAFRCFGKMTDYWMGSYIIGDWAYGITLKGFVITIIQLS